MLLFGNSIPLSSPSNNGAGNYLIDLWIDTEENIEAVRVMEGN